MESKMFVRSKDEKWFGTRYYFGTLNILWHVVYIKVVNKSFYDIIVRERITYNLGAKYFIHALSILIFFEEYDLLHSLSNHPNRSHVLFSCLNFLFDPIRHCTNTCVLT